jgi:hypothetical protein
MKDTKVVPLVIFRALAPVSDSTFPSTVPLPFLLPLVPFLLPLVPFLLPLVPFLLPLVPFLLPLVPFLLRKGTSDLPLVPLLLSLVPFLLPLVPFLLPLVPFLEPLVPFLLPPCRASTFPFLVLLEGKGLALKGASAPTLARFSASPFPSTARRKGTSAGNSQADQDSVPHLHR